jgi:hypothetical protein
VRIRTHGGPDFAFYALAKSYERTMVSARSGGSYATA